MKQNDGFRNIIKRIPYSTLSIDHQNLFSIVENADDFEKIIDKEIKQFEGQNINVSACLENFENMVDIYITKLLGQLEREHINNMQVIAYLFRKRASDKIEFQELLEELEEIIDVTKAEYEQVKKWTEEQNPLKNGRLAIEKNLEKEDEINE